MTPLSPRLLKGGIVQVDPGSGKVLRTIALQYNPDSLTRSLQVQAAGEGNDRSQALRLKGAAIETIKLEVEIDATDALEFPKREPDRGRASGSTLSSRLLEGLVHAARRRAAGQRRSDRRGRARDPAARVAADAVRLEQAARRAGADHRSQHHRGGVRRRAQPDPREGRASGCGSSRVDDVGFAHRAGRRFMGYLRTKEGLAGRVQPEPASQIGFGG